MSSLPASQPESDLARITQIMYEKNLELAQRNKMLDLLAKIDHIILSKLTKVEQISDQVTNVIIQDSHLKSVFIYLFSQKDAILTPLSVAFAEKKVTLDDNLLKAIYSGRISAQENSHPVVRAISQKKPLNETQLSAFFPQIDQEKACSLQSQFGLEKFTVHPFFVREETTGVIVFGFGKKEVSDQYWQDFIVRLPEVISIALNNAFLYNKIEDSNQKLRELDKLKDEFVSLASHELRTPMAAIRSYLYLALQEQAGSLNDKQKYYLERSYSSVSRLIKLVNDMLNISRIESGRMSLEIKKIDLLALVNEVIAEIKPKIEEKQIQLLINKQELLSVLADADKLKEVLINLLGNSLKFVEKGGKIQIDFAVNNDEVKVSVMDNGSGINKDDLPKLFQKFNLLGSSYVTNKDTSQGTGLGLYISKEIIKMHQGQIWAESPGLGKGSTFSFTLKVYTESKLQELAKLNNREGLGIIHASLD